MTKMGWQRCAVLGCNRGRAPGRALCAECMRAPVILSTLPGRETTTLWLHPACASRVADSRGWRVKTFETMTQLPVSEAECVVCGQDMVAARGGRRVPAQERLW